MMETTPKPPEPKPPEPKPLLPLPVLLSCFFSRLHFDLNPKWDANIDGQESGDLSFVLSLGRTRNVKRRQLALRVILSSPPEKVAPYLVDAEILAVFEQEIDDRPVAEIDRHIALVGGPMLYGAVREQLLTLSARTHAPRLVLPMQYTKELLANLQTKDLEPPKA